MRATNNYVRLKNLAQIEIENEQKAKKLKDKMVEYDEISKQVKDEKKAKLNMTFIDKMAYQR